MASSFVLPTDCGDEVSCDFPVKAELSLSIPFLLPSTAGAQWSPSHSSSPHFPPPRAYSASYPHAAYSPEAPAALLEAPMQSCPLIGDESFSWFEASAVASDEIVGSCLASDILYRPPSPLGLLCSDGSGGSGSEACDGCDDSSASSHSRLSGGDREEGETPLFPSSPSAFSFPSVLLSPSLSLSATSEEEEGEATPPSRVKAPSPAPSRPCAPLSLPRVSASTRRRSRGSGAERGTRKRRLPSSSPEGRRSPASARSPAWRAQEEPPVPPVTTRWTSTLSSTSASSSSPSSSSPSPPVVEEEKRDRNKRSASEYRKRRKVYVLSLERSLQEANQALNEVQSTMRKLTAENGVLRHSMQVLSRLVHKDRAEDSAGLAQLLDAGAGLRGAKGEEERAEGAEKSPLLVPAGFRPVAPSLQRDGRPSDASMAEEEPQRGMRTRGRQSRRPSGARRPQAGLLLAVLFSCFLLYLPWLMDLGGPADSNTALYAASFLANSSLHFPSSAPFSSSPDCSLSSSACNRGRTLLTLHSPALDSVAAVDGEKESWMVALPGSWGREETQSAEVGEAASPLLSSPFNATDSTAAFVDDWSALASSVDFDDLSHSATAPTTHATPSK